MTLKLLEFWVGMLVALYWSVCWTRMEPAQGEER